MTGTQVVIAVGYGVLVLGTVLFAVFVVRSTAARERRKGFDYERAMGRENRFAWLIVALLLGLMAATAFAIPYDETEADEGGEVVDVQAFQFGWTVDPAQVPVDVPIEFRARSADVQHGLGIYDGAKLLAQVQVPANHPGADTDTGQEQRLVHTFDHPGTYDILCLEFCGSKHQAMQAQIEVTE